MAPSPTRRRLLFRMICMPYQRDWLRYCCHQRIVKQLLQHALVLLPVAAGLTLLRGFVAAGQPPMTSDRLASFEQWDDRGRQAVLWTGQQGFVEIGDPTSCIEAAKEEEPVHQKLAAFPETVAALLEDSSWCIAGLIRVAGDQCANVLGDRENIIPPPARCPAGDCWRTR